jgi:HK97 family phage prohead protease
MQTERRSASIEVRAKGRRLEGHAALFGVETRIGNDFIERIARGAFADSLSGDVLALVDHDPGRVLARTKSGTLRLAEDSKGLHFDLDIPSTSYGNDILALVESRNAGGMSFGFTVPDGGDCWNGTRRELRKVNLMEISVVSAWPAYEGTIVQARSRPLVEPVRLALARKYLELI